MTTLIDGTHEAWDPSMVDDPVQDRLLEIIAAKKKGEAARKGQASREAPRSNVINIMDALRKSIAAENGAGRRK